ncbi:hypothetical protein ACEQ8H_006919 [Pleosporales sp. CAS-2024a]
MASSLAAAKKELRKKMRNVLRELPKASVASQSAHVTQTLLSMPEYKAARSISIYLSMPGGEIATTSIVRDALDQGKRVFIPYTYTVSSPPEAPPRSIMDMVELQSTHDLDALEPDKWGIPTPSSDSIASRANCFGGHGVTNGDMAAASDGLDLIVMPAMAFDSALGRLGHGKGFYDSFLARCHHMSRMPFRVGLSLEEQLLPPNESVPMDTSDYRLDALVVGHGSLHRAPA